MHAWGARRHAVCLLKSLAQIEVGLRNGLRHPRESGGPGQALDLCGPGFPLLREWRWRAV